MGGGAKERFFKKAEMSTQSCSPLRSELLVNSQGSSYLP